jgi:hypothetical protein
MRNKKMTYNQIGKAKADNKKAMSDIENKIGTYKS